MASVKLIVGTEKLPEFGPDRAGFWALVLAGTSKQLWAVDFNEERSSATV